MFWKKKANNIKEKDKQKHQLSKKPVYVVTICDKLSKSEREVATFNAVQERDIDDGLLYLINEEADFKALFPSRRNIVLNNKSIDELKKEIKELKKKTIKETENPLNVQSKVNKLERELYYLEHPSGDFISFTEDGMPRVRFLRVNSNFIPLVTDIDLSCIYVPAEPNLKDSLDSIIAKKEKYKLKKDKLKGILEVIMWIINIILLIGNGVWIYHNMVWADSKSSLALLKNEIDASAIMCNKALAQTNQLNSETAIINRDNAEQTGNILTNIIDDVMNTKPDYEIKVENIK